MKSYVVKYKNDDGEWVQSYGGVGEAGARDAFELHKECDHTAYLVTQEDGGEYDSLEFHGDDLGELSNITRECQREKELRTMGGKEVKYQVRYYSEGKWATSYEGKEYELAVNAMDVHKGAEQSCTLGKRLANGYWINVERHVAKPLMGGRLEYKNETEEENTYSIPTFTVEDTNRTTVHLTRRDYFAGQALLHGLVFTRFDFKPEEAAERAYKYADALIKESNK